MNHTDRKKDALLGRDEHQTGRGRRFFVACEPTEMYSLLGVQRNVIERSLYGEDLKKKIKGKPTFSDLQNIFHLATQRG